MHQAFEAEESAEIVSKARQALEIWPDCADAYVLLAEQARGPKEAHDLYALGLKAALGALGEEILTEANGQFWSLLETRPYMRARHGLAQTLWILGRRGEAVEHYQDMLRLNPNDHQGIRYNLAACLIEMARDEELEALLSRYEKDASVSWLYSAALLAYRREGDSPRARKLLAAGRKKNPFVPDYITGRELLPSRMPETLGSGTPDEAVDYAVGFLNGWRTTTGAMAWLRKTTANPRLKTSKKAKVKGPTSAVKTRIRRLPQPFDAVWQVETRQLPVWMSVEGENVRPWIVLVISQSDELILGQDVLAEPPTTELLWDKLIEAMESPAMGDPHRPARVEVRPGDLWDALSPHLDDLEIQRDVTEQLELVDNILEKLVEHVCGRAPGPGLLDMPGITPERVEDFFQAAASFYRAAPWQKVGGAETIRIACDQFESGPWYAVIIGQMGMTLGIALYEDLDALIRMKEGNASDEQNARDTVALSVTYGDQTEVPVPDLEAIEHHQWEVAGPDAYPAPIRKERGLTMRPPLAWELQLLEACLRAMPQFIDSHDRASRDPGLYPVPTRSGLLTLSLSWATEDPVS
ncbi:MAG: hypothetical protein NVSMB9_15410 [Isosphaeraceae bacterium]